MKNKSFLIFVLLAVFATIFTSCETTKTKAARESDPYFLADMNAFEVGQVVGLTKQNFLKPKAVDVSVEFYPRTSSVSFAFKDALNKVALIFEPEEYEAFCESINKYTEIKDSDGFQKNYKPNRKNSFYKGNVTILWGVASLGRQVLAPFETNYEWLEVNNVTNPYFKLYLKPTDYPEEANVASPTISLYFTPSQAKELTTIVKNDEIMKKIEEFNAAAYSFE